MSEWYDPITKYGKYIALAIVATIIAIALIVWGKKKGDNRLVYAGVGVIAAAAVVGVGGYVWENQTAPTTTTTRTTGYVPATTRDYVPE